MPSSVAGGDDKLKLGGWLILHILPLGRAVITKRNVNARGIYCRPAIPVRGPKCQHSDVRFHLHIQLPIPMVCVLGGAGRRGGCWGLHELFVSFQHFDICTCTGTAKLNLAVGRLFLLLLGGTSFPCFKKIPARIPRHRFPHLFPCPQFPASLWEFPAPLRVLHLYDQNWVKQVLKTYVPCSRQHFWPIALDKIQT